MDKLQMQNYANEIYGMLQRATATLEERSLRTLAAKVTLENAKAGAANMAGWAEQKNDKSRELYLKLVCEQEYAALDKATEEERSARLSLTLTQLEVERLRLIVKINCEWQED
jgi:cystathionine beta-lyase/cystathionine gamma-synthase